MMSSVDIWKVLAGVAIFLIGIRFLEESLHQLSGRRFKLFLKKQTSSKIKAIGGGAIVAGVLQSSSVVNLMVLAFVGAGILSMQNALAVMLGSNLGTTVTGWIVALAGFNLNIEQIALPVAAVAGLGYAILNKQGRWYTWCRFFLGFSFLFVGLGYMKTGIEGMVMHVDLQQFEQAPLVVFFLIGFVITALIQSSSATMAITLSALNAGAISLLDSTAIILGSEVGTTIKLFLASLKGISLKRKVAMGNFMFNTITVILVMIFLVPLNRFITEVIGIRDSLIALVFFQSLINVIGIILFYPLLNLFSGFLEKRFRGNDDETLFIHKVDSLDPAIALFAMEKENRHFIYTVLDFTWSCFETPNHHLSTMGLRKDFPGKPIQEKYEYIKFLHGEIHAYAVQLQKSLSEKEDIEKLNRLVSSVRNTMYAAKNIKDAIPDTGQLRNSSNDVKYSFYLQTQHSVDVFCTKVFALLNENTAPDFEEMIALYHSVTGDYTTALQQLYRENTADHVDEKEITTLLNFNREIFTAFKSFFFGVKDHLFDKEQSRHFDELPGFIR